VLPQRPNFEEYCWALCELFCPGWHYYLGDIIASIPVPMEFGKGEVESGVVTKVLRGFAENPSPYLDEAMRKKMAAANSSLLQKFTELTFDESAEMRWQDSRPTEADNIDVGLVTGTDLQDDLVEPSGNPF
jgi:hypothetical protein